MSLNFPYKDLLIDIYDDMDYNPASADNTIKYDEYYTTETRQIYVTQHGLRVTSFSGQTLKQVCVAASGGMTGIHKNSCVLLNETIAICCADTIFSLALPELSLRWKTRADDATCFGIFNHKEGYIVHGELEISKLDDRGKMIWRFSGNDSFKNPIGRNDFKVENNRIYATNWDNVSFQLDADNGNLLMYDAKNAKYS